MEEKIEVEERSILLDKLKNLITLLRRADRKRSARLDKEDIDFLDVIEATRGLDKIGDKYPIGSEAYVAARDLYSALDELEKWAVDEETKRIFRDYKKDLAKDLYARSHKSGEEDMILASTVIDATVGEIRHPPVEIKEVKRNES